MLLDFIFFKVNTDDVILWFFRGLFLVIGLAYVIYVLLQLRQIGIMNSTLKTKAGVPIALVGIIHLILVILTLIIVEVLLFLND